jgi:hypothetical protein
MSAAPRDHPTDNKTCYHLAGTAIDFTYQIWIADDGTFLPVKLNIVYTDNEANDQYTALYEQWTINPTLQNSMFDFNAPANSMKVKFSVKK